LLRQVVERRKLGKDKEYLLYYRAPAGKLPKAPEYRRKDGVSLHRCHIDQGVMIQRLDLIRTP
jgi:hypothetical protein